MHSSKTEKELSKTVLFCGIILFIFIAVNFYLALHHEPWRDEAQVWLLSRDMKLWELPFQMHYEGHPCLWHLIMGIPLIINTAPIVVQTIISFVIMTGILWVILFHTGLPAYLKVVLAISPVFTYYMPVIARNYTLVVAILVLLGVEFKNRFTHPWRYALLIALLTQTHSVMIMTALALSVCFMTELSFWAIKRDKEKIDLSNSGSISHLLPLSLPLAGGLFWLAQMYYDKDNSGLLNVRTASLRRTVEKMYETLGDILERMFGPAQSVGVFLLLLLALFLISGTVLFLVKTFGIGKTSAYGAAVIIPTFIFQLWFYTMVYTWSVQKVICFFALILWWLIICEKDGITDNRHIGSDMRSSSDNTDNKPKGNAAERFALPSFLWSLRCPLFAVSLILLLPTAIKRDIIPDIQGPYSNSRAAAAFINENIDYKSGSCLIVTDNQAEVSAILPYTYGLHPIYGPTGEGFTYVTWDDNWNARCENHSFYGLIDNLKEEGREIYIISCPERSYVDDGYDLENHYELIYESEGRSVKGEDYRIYRVK